MTPEQLEQLPKYAKREIDSLQAQLRVAQETLATLLNETPSRTQIEGLSVEPIQVPNHVAVQFQVGHHRIRDTLTVRRIDDYRVEVVGGDQVFIRPVSGNLFLAGIWER